LPTVLRTVLEGEPFLVNQASKNNRDCFYSPPESEIDDRTNNAQSSRSVSLSTHSNTVLNHNIFNIKHNQNQRMITMIILLFLTTATILLILDCSAVDGFMIVDHCHHHQHYSHGHEKHGIRTSSPSVSPSTSRIRTEVTELGCQLLGMNCATPTDFKFSLKGFCRRGGDTDIHCDGWGLAYYEGSSIRQFHDCEAAATSPMADFLSSQNIQTLNMMAHLRYATVGEVNLSNVHPFAREMWGIQWVFAMNGDLDCFKTNPTMKLKSLGPNGSPCREDSYYHPVGTTDSEAAFCAIMNALRVKFDSLPSLPVLHQAINELCNEIVMQDSSGSIFNFLLTCGEHTLWCYSFPGSRPGSDVWNGLYYTTRKYPFSTASLKDCDHVVDFKEQTTEDSVVSVVATKPLTDDEEWIEIQRGELIVFDQGLPNNTPESLFEIELRGRGLQSTFLGKAVIEEDMRSFNLDPSNFQGSCI
jgi:predicted glutamine amidotransferase